MMKVIASFAILVTVAISQMPAAKAAGETKLNPTDGASPMTCQVFTVGAGCADGNNSCGICAAHHLVSCGCITPTQCECCSTGGEC